VRLPVLREWSILLDDVVCGENHFKKGSTSCVGVYAGVLCLRAPFWNEGEGVLGNGTALEVDFSDVDFEVER
jgi:hypothetical protein